MENLHTIPARRGKAVRLNKGQAIQIVNTHGQQVVNTWAFNASDLSEFLSMEHMRATLSKIFPAKGDALITNRRRPILHLEEDTSPGRHDTVIAACDIHRYMGLGCRDYHDNCTDNLHAALGLLGVTAADYFTDTLGSDATGVVDALHVQRSYREGNRMDRLATRIL